MAGRLRQPPAKDRAESSPFTACIQLGCMGAVLGKKEPCSVAKASLPETWSVPIMRTRTYTRPPIALGDKAPGVLSDPGRIDIDLLAKYWRKESVAAAKRMANRLGVRCVVGLYPWMAIWEAEGLAPPAKSHWAMLQQDHMTTNEVALRLDCDARTIRRYVTNPPDDFPLPVFGNGKPWLWRAAQIQAYVRGTPLPRFRRSTSHRATNGSDGNELPALRAQAPRPSTFDPFCSQ